MNFLYMSFSAGYCIVYGSFADTFQEKIAHRAFLWLMVAGNAAGIGSVFDSVCLQRL